MIRSIIIDDEQHCLESLSLQLNEYCPDVQVLEQCSSGDEGWEAISKFRPELVFLDIEMPLMNGFELLERLSAISFAIIFTTSYDQYAIKAIRFSALDYLLKPIDPKELVVAINKVREQRHLPVAEQFQQLLQHIKGNNNGFNKIAVPTAEGFELIPVENIMYCEANDNYTHFFLKNRSKIVACRILKDIETQLQDFSFFVRVHNSYLVNLNEVTRYVRGDGGHLIMSDDTAVSVSRSRKDSLLKHF